MSETNLLTYGQLGLVGVSGYFWFNTLMILCPTFKALFLSSKLIWWRFWRGFCTISSRSVIDFTFRTTKVPPNLKGRKRQEMDKRIR